MFEHNLKPEDVGNKADISLFLSKIKTNSPKVLGLFFVVVSVSAIGLYLFNIIAYKPKISPVSPKVLGAFTVRDTQNVQENSFPVLDANVPAPELTSSSALAYEANGPILYSFNPDRKVPIASLTKLMTALLVMTDSRYTQPITIAANDKVNINPVLNLKVGDVVMPADLIQSMLIGSANDAAMTLANHFATSDKTFLDQMNAEAQKLGMISTHYSTPIGFDDPQNYSTARDLQKLVYAVIPILPFSKTDHASSYSFKSIGDKPTSYSIKTTSKLPDAQPNIGVLKTGFTDDAKEAMVAESNVHGNEVISIVLQSDNRDADTSAIFAYINKAYDFNKK